MKSKIEIIPYEQIITDIAGNMFIIRIYYDLDGNVVREIKPYDAKKENVKNVKNNLNYNYNGL